MVATKDTSDKKEKAKKVASPTKVKAKSVDKSKNKPVSAGKSIANFDVIIAPHMTEKAHMVSPDGKVIFKVNTKSNKEQVKLAVEDILEVEVKSVNIMNVKGKRKMFKGRIGKRSDWAKAIVTLKDKESVQKLMAENA